MEAEHKETRPRWKTALQVTGAVCVVLALAGLTAYTWKAQGRNTEDAHIAVLRQAIREAEVAKSLAPMIDRLEALRGTVAGLKQGDPDYEKYFPQLMQLQNLIGDQMPALVASRDASGNATIVGTDMAKAHLRSLVEAAESGK